MKKWLVLGLVAIGIVWSVRDYREWRVVERGHYGHGLNEGVAGEQVVDLVGPYVNSLAGFRIRYPKDWDVVDQKNKVTFVHPFALTDLGDKPEAVVYAIQTKRNVADETQAKVDELATEAITLVGDRANYSTDRIEVVVLTWHEGVFTRQWALGQKNGKFVVVEAKTLTKYWDKFAKTFEEMYKSLVVY